MGLEHNTGCSLWVRSLVEQHNKWRQIGRIQKHLITSNLKVKSAAPYEILLVEARLFPMEALSIIHLLMYLKKVDGMDEHW